MTQRKIICANCGNETVATGPRTKYCPLCAYKIRLEKQNERRSWRRADPAHTRKITCEICGNEFETNSKAARAKYCPECSARAFKISAKKHREKEKKWLLEETRQITCERCGVVLEDQNNSRRKYCNDCAAAVKREQTYESAQRKKEMLLEERRSPFKGCISKETHRVSQIEEIQKAAQEAGMSYGKYKAMLAMHAARKGVSRR